MTFTPCQLSNFMSISNLLYQQGPRNGLAQQLCSEFFNASTTSGLLMWDKFIILYLRKTALWQCAMQIKLNQTECSLNFQAKCIFLFFHCISYQKHLSILQVRNLLTLEYFYECLSSWTGSKFILYSNHVCGLKEYFENLGKKHNRCSDWPNTVSCDTITTLNWVIFLSFSIPQCVLSLCLSLWLTFLIY